METKPKRIKQVMKICIQTFAGAPSVRSNTLDVYDDGSVIHHMTTYWHHHKTLAECQQYIARLQACYPDCIVVAGE